jgi:hypothetical protein
MNDLYDAATERAERERKAAQIERLIARLRKENHWGWARFKYFKLSHHAPTR